MSLDLFSHLDRFSGGGVVSYLIFWWVSLYAFIWVISGAGYWMVMNWVEALVLRLHKFDPGQMHKSQPFSDPGFSSLICSCWLVVGFTGFMSLFPYFNDLARDPAFIYSVTMTLWWYALSSYAICSPKNLAYSVFLGTKNILNFLFMFILESVSWVSRGLTFGARFLASGSFGTCVSYILCDMLSNYEGLGYSGFMILAGCFAWNLYEVLAMTFQCYLIGLLGICFCSPRPMNFSGGLKSGFSMASFLQSKRQTKRSGVLEHWVKLLS